MKHLIQILLIAAAITGAAFSQESPDDKAAILGSAVDKNADFLLLRDASVTSGATLKKLTLAELANVPSLFAASSHTHTLSNLSQSSATTGQVPTWNGSAWVPATNNSNPLGYISQTDYGIVAGDSSDVTATANATALTTAFSAAASTGKTLLLNGQIYVKGEVLISGEAIKILGNNAEIIQKDTSQNGLTLASDSGSPPYGLSITGVAITGQGPATHAASGIYGKKGDLSYLTSDITLRNCKITGFRNGTNLAGIAKFFTENLTISNVRIGHEWNHMQTVLCLNSRIVSGDSDSSSACFKLTGGNFFSNRIIMGEFGGTGFARFLTMTEGLFFGESLNLEGFTANQTINVTGTTGTRKIELKNTRIGIAYSASTQAIISCEVNGNTGSPVLNLTNVSGWSGSPRIVEIYGTIATGGAPIVDGGSPLYVQYAATQGGTVDHAVRVNPSMLQYQTSAAFPVSGSEPGQFIEHSSSSGTTGDLLGTNVLLRRKNNRSGSNEWSSIVNDALYRSLAVTGRVASGNNVETDMHNANIPIGLLGNNGESVEIKAFGSCAATANNKQFKFYFGGSQYFDFGSLAINNESWILTVLIQRGSFAGGTGYMKMVGILDYGSGKVIKTAETPSAAIDSSAAISTRLTVLTPSAASDAVSLAAKMTWTRTPQGF